jgi:hypothetical protein
MAQQQICCTRCETVVSLEASFEPKTYNLQTFCSNRCIVASYERCPECGCPSQKQPADDDHKTAATHLELPRVCISCKASWSNCRKLDRRCITAATQREAPATCCCVAMEEASTLHESRLAMAYRLQEPVPIKLSVATVEIPKACPLPTEQKKKKAEVPTQMQMCKKIMEQWVSMMMQKAEMSSTEMQARGKKIVEQWVSMIQAEQEERHARFWNWTGGCPTYLEDPWRRPGYHARIEVGEDGIPRCGEWVPIIPQQAQKEDVKQQ